MTGPSLTRRQKTSQSAAQPGAAPNGATLAREKRVLQKPVLENDWLSPRAAWAVAFALVAGVFAVYGPALNFQFVLDDHRFTGDPRLQSSGHVWEYFTSYVWAQVPGGPLSFYRPVFVLWLRLNHVVAGVSPWGWHLLSIAKHAFVAVLLGWLVWKLLHDRVAALLAGTLFAVHPAQTESVAWVTVPDPLMSAAVLGSLLLYLRYADRESAGDQSHAARAHKKSRKQSPGKAGAGSSAAWVIASATACLAALMAKETAVVLPAIFFATALIVPFGEAGREAVSEKGSGFRVRLVSASRRTLPFLAVTAIYLLLRVNALEGQLSPPTQHLPWSTVLLSWPATLWFYVKVLLWPIRPRAFADPTLVDSFSLRGVLFPALGVGCALALLVAACVWAWRKSRRDLPEQEVFGVERAMILGSFLLVLPILLTLNLNALNPGDFLHGRYAYLPLAGLMLLFATGWHLLGRNGRIVALSVAVFAAVAFSILTVKQESAWKDDLTVFTIAHQYAPHNLPVAENLVKAHVQVALGLDDEDRCDEAMPIFDDAIRQYPQDWFAWAGRGDCLVKLKDLPGAEQSLRRASELSHEPHVTEQWQQVRAMMGLSATTSPP